MQRHFTSLLRLEQRDPRKAFTLVEVIVALFISTFFLGAAATLIYFLTEQIFAATEETNFNNVVRKITTRMAEDVREASWFHVYQSFSTASRDDPADRISIGGAGNLVVLFYAETDYTTVPTHEKVSRIVGYYVDTAVAPPAAPAPDTVPVRRFEMTPPPGTTWYANPAIIATDYTPSTAIVADPSLTSLESYFASITSTSSGIETIIDVDRPSTLPVFNNNNTFLTITTGTLFGNVKNNMRQTFNFSASPQG